MKRATPMLAALLAAAALAGPSAPPAGAYGFDWLKPATARCVPVKANALPACEARPEGSFGLSDRVWACRSSARSEWLVYADQAACLRNLETMRGNAP